MKKIKKRILQLKDLSKNLNKVIKGLEEIDSCPRCEYGKIVDNKCDTCLRKVKNG